MLKNFEPLRTITFKVVLSEKCLCFLDFCRLILPIFVTCCPAEEQSCQFPNRLENRLGAIPQGFESLSLRHFKQNLRLKRYVLSVFFVLFAQAISIFCRAEHGFSRSAQASLRNLGNPCAIRLFRHRKILRASFFRCFFDDFSAISACFLRFGIVPCTTGVVKGGQIYGFFHSTQRLGLVVPAQMGVNIARCSNVAVP